MKPSPQAHGNVHFIRSRTNSMTLITKKVLAASAAALMLLPMAASAHEGLKLGSFVGQGILHANINANVGGTLGGNVGHKSGDNDNDGDNDGRHATSTTAVGVNASTTAAAIDKKATRISNVADFMGSLSTNLAARIASSSLSASSTATANAQLGDYNTNVANAKTQATAAMTAAGNLSDSNATSTNAGFIATAQADLQAARGFLQTAAKDLHLILQAIFNA
jgi:hypothetical protein